MAARPKPRLVQQAPKPKDRDDPAVATKLMRHLRVGGKPVRALPKMTTNAEPSMPLSADQRERYRQISLRVIGAAMREIS